jgi:hypothetical protein
MSMRSEAGSVSSCAVPAAEREAKATEAGALAIRVSPAREAVASNAADVQRDPLSEADLAALELAATRLRALRRAVTIARLHAVCWLGFALACVPLALLDPRALWAALLACASGLAELHGARLLRALDVRGPRWLGVHQLILLTAVAIYCGYGIHAGSSAQSISDQLTQASPDLATMLDHGDGEQARQLVTAMDGAYRVALVGFYLVLLFVTALYQGALAHYHFSRAAFLRAFLRDTPRWAATAVRRLLGW